MILGLIEMLFLIVINYDLFKSFKLLKSRFLTLKSTMSRPFFCLIAKNPKQCFRLKGVMKVVSLAKILNAIRRLSIFYNFKAPHFPLASIKLLLRPISLTIFQVQN